MVRIRKLEQRVEVWKNFGSVLLHLSLPSYTLYTTVTFTLLLLPCCTKDLIPPALALKIGCGRTVGLGNILTLYQNCDIRLDIVLDFRNCNTIGVVFSWF